MENLLHYIATQRLSVLARYSITTVIVGAFFLLRLQMGDTAGVYGFFVFIPAVFLTSLLFDRGSGLLATVLCTGAVMYLLDPSGTFGITRQHVFPVTFFALECIGITVLSEALRKALERATKAERKNDLMFQELAHRTKNNLQMIASMLALQARAQTDPALQGALNSAVARVQVIATAHDRLQPNGTEGLVNVRDYLEDICRFLGDSLRGLRPVAVRVNVEPIVIDSKKAVPLGLIVNELVTNAFKYAFPEGSEGAVDVVLQRIGANEVELKVQDNGVGCSTEHEGLGSRLIKLLVQQLGGSIHREPLEPGCLITARLTL